MHTHLRLFVKFTTVNIIIIYLHCVYKYIKIKTDK